MNNKWIPISDIPKELLDIPPSDIYIDLFGHIDYDQIEVRITNCEFIEGEWHHLDNGCMEPISDLSYEYTPTHYMVVTKPGD